ncbi:MAG: CRISPR-associated ring nuclease [Methylobacter sp.]
MPNILLCTLGASWAVIPEAYAFLAPEKLPLYRHHPESEKLLNLKKQYQLADPDEIWVCTTQGEQARTSLQYLQNWVRECPQPPVLRIWQAEQTDQLAGQEECALIKELIARTCLKAHQYADSSKSQVILCLAGGRKTMSADLQWAGSLFGCQALLHVISADNLPDELRKAQPALLTQALPSDLAKQIMPLMAGQSTRSDLLDIRVDTAGPIRSEDYPLELPEINQSISFQTSSVSLVDELNKREKASSRLFGNFLQELSDEERHENWRSLYRLPPRIIQQLRETRIEDQHKDWLVRLPKADLHRHLGGCLDLDAQRRVGQAIWQNLSPQQKKKALDHCAPLLNKKQWDWDWPRYLNSHAEERSHNIAALLVEADNEQMQINLWGSTLPRLALKHTHSRGFAAYERPGELTGSAVLSHPSAIQPYAEAIVHQAIAEGLSCVELRGSPQKYSNNGLEFLQRFYQGLTSAMTSLSMVHPLPLFRFIIIVDRRDSQDQLAATLKMAIEAKQEWPEFIVGLDMAGDEKQTKPEDIAHLFTPVFEQCMPLTIHAGEGEDAESIWQATYHLHADRIGHGLSINDNEKLAHRFRDRNICLELCPTSNREVVGYKDSSYPESAVYPLYPLLELWQKGLPLTICTDNPGISHTTLADEYLTVARMTGGKLSQWDALAMIKQGFVHSFISGDQKEKMLKQADASLYRILSEQI